jgi:hypothetical protein
MGLQQPRRGPCEAHLQEPVRPVSFEDKNVPSTLIPDPSPNIRRREFYSVVEKPKCCVLNPLPLAGEGGELVRRVRASGEVKSGILEITKKFLEV